MYVRRATSFSTCIFARKRFADSRAGVGGRRLNCLGATAPRRLRLGLGFLGRPVVVLGGSLAVGVGLLWVPTSFHFGAFSTPSVARDFLSTLWQVEGGTIALTLTVILVAFEPSAQPLPRFSSSLRRRGLAPVRDCGGVRVASRDRGLPSRLG